MQSKHNINPIDRILQTRLKTNDMPEILLISTPTDKESFILYKAFQKQETINAR